MTALKRVLVIVFAALVAHAAVSAPLTVSSDPPGALVCASPADEPVTYRKGITPCTIELDPERGPHALRLSLPGHFDGHAMVGPGQEEVSVELAPLDAPEAWERLPAIEYVRAEPATEDRLVLRFIRDGLPGPVLNDELEWPVSEVGAWAPDGRSLTVRGSSIPLGGYDAPSELWWVSLDGEARRVWRWIANPEKLTTFYIDSDFSPDPRWFVHSAPEDDLEHIRLHVAPKNESLRIAADEGASLSLPSFSPDGRWIALLKSTGPDLRLAKDNLQTMRWDGSKRRTVGEDVQNIRPTFSPDTSLVAWVAWTGEVMVAPVDGGEPRAVIDEPDWSGRASPVWSPAGGRIAATCEPRFAPRDPTPRQEHEGPPYYRTIWADVDGGASGAIRGCRILRWYNEQTIIGVVPTFAEEAGLTYERICMIDLQGRLVKVLHEPQLLLHHPALAPDGERVALVGWHPRADSGVYLYHLPTEALTKLPGIGDVVEVGWTEDRRVWALAESDGERRNYAIDPASGQAERLPRKPTLADAPPEMSEEIRADGDLYDGRGWFDRLTWLRIVPEIGPVPTEGGADR